MRSGVQHREFARHHSTRAFAKHVDAAGVDRIILLRPCQQLLDWHEIGLPQPSPGALSTNGQKHVIVAQPQPLERLANREDIGAGRGDMFLEAEDHAHLPRGIGRARGRGVRRSFHDVVHDGLTGFVFQFGLIGGEKRRHTTASRDQNDGHAAKRSIHSFH